MRPCVERCALKHTNAHSNTYSGIIAQHGKMRKMGVAFSQPACRLPCCRIRPRQYFRPREPNRRQAVAGFLAGVTQTSPAAAVIFGQSFIYAPVEYMNIYRMIQKQKWHRKQTLLPFSLPASMHRKPCFSSVVHKKKKMASELTIFLESDAITDVIQFT